MAVAPCFFPYPSAATYPPFFYHAPPAFPYPTPASAYTPPPGFFPAPAYGPSTIPSATTSYPPEFGSFLSESSCPTREVTPIPTTLDQNQPPPATPIPPDHHTSFDCSISSRSLSSFPNSPLKPPPVSVSNKLYGDLSLRSPLYGRPKLQQHMEGGRKTEDDDDATTRYGGATFKIETSSDACHPAMPDSIYQGSNPSKGNGARGASIDGEQLVRKHTGPEILSTGNAGSTQHFASAPSPTLDARTQQNDERVPAKEAIRHQLQRELLSIKARMDQQQEFEGNSFATIRGEISRLSEVAVRLASSLGRTNNPTNQTKPEQSSVSAAPTCVAPEVFGEMPAQNSLQETNGTTPGHHNPIQNSCVSTNFSDGKQQQYGFHNLNDHSVFLADGSEHSYYALPENYPLEQPTAEPVFDVYADETNGYSAEFVDLLAGMHEQQTYEADRRETEQPTKCFGKPTLDHERPRDVVVSLTKQTKPDNEQIVVSANKASDHVFSEDATDFTSVLAPCSIVGVSIECRARNLKTKPRSLPESALCCTHGKPQHVHNQQWNMWMSEPGKKEWDPGILRLLNMLQGKTASPNQVHSGKSCLVTKVVEVKVDSGKPIISPERPTDGIFSFTIEKKSENELLAVCFNNTSNNAFSDIDFPFPHGPVTHAARSIELTKENSTQVASVLFVPGATVHFTDEISEINIKKQVVLVKKHKQLCDISNDKEELLWDLGSVMSTTICSIYFLKFGVREAYPIFSPGHILTWNPWSVTFSLCQSLWEFSREQATQMPWDPGDATIAMACEQATTCWRMGFMEEDQKENEQFAKFLHMASENAFIEQSTVLRHPTDPELHIDWVPRITIGNHIKELSVSDSSLAIQQAELHQILTQQWHMMLMKEYCLADQKVMAKISSKMAVLTWHSSITGTPLILLSSTNYTWDPGVLCIIDNMMLDKYPVSHQVQFVQLKAEHLFLSLTACIRYIVANGINSILHATCFILRRAAQLTQDTYLCSLYCKSVPQTSYVWVPGVKISFSSWLNILTVWPATEKPLSSLKTPEPATWHRQVTSAPKQWIFWFNAMHYCHIFQKYVAMSSQFYWHQDIKFYTIALWLVNFNPP